jgi:hypothetical protein
VTKSATTEGVVYSFKLYSNYCTISCQIKIRSSGYDLINLGKNYNVIDLREGLRRPKIQSYKLRGPFGTNYKIYDCDYYFYS